MKVVINLLIIFFGSIIFLLFINFLINNTKKILQYLFKIKSFFKIRKLQNYFFIYERYNKIIYLNKKKYFYFNNYLFLLKDLNKKINLKKKFRKLIIIFFSKNKFFNYILDESRFNRVVSNNSINYFKINVENKKHFEFEINKNDLILKTFHVKKSKKKKLVLILFLDGLSNQLSNFLINSNKFFSKNNNFSNAFTNGSWTLPTFSNLITGQYTSTHLNFKPVSYYSSLKILNNFFQSTSVKTEFNIFQFFKSQEFITGCYSPYIRINPTYNFDNGVDIFKFCENENTSEIIDNIISQLEMFDENSNFIFAHLFDVHSKAKNIFQLSDYAYYSDKNFNYKEKLSTEKKIKSKKEKFIKFKNFNEQQEVINDVKFCDLRLNSLYNYLNKKNFDDYTVILMGDHGTRMSELDSKAIINIRYNNIGFFIKDKKNNFKNKKNNLIETIDVFPSLAAKYSKNKLNSKMLNQFNGKNTLYSNFNKKFTISENIYNYDYDILINDKNNSLLSSYKINNNLSISHYKNHFNDKLGNKIKSPKSELVNKFKAIEKVHLKNSNLYK